MIAASSSAICHCRERRAVFEEMEKVTKDSNVCEGWSSNQSNNYAPRNLEQIFEPLAEHVAGEQTRLRQRCVLNDAREALIEELESTGRGMEREQEILDRLDELTVEIHRARRLAFQGRDEETRDRCAQACQRHDEWIGAPSRNRPFKVRARYVRVGDGKGKHRPCGAIASSKVWPRKRDEDPTAARQARRCCARYTKYSVNHGRWRSIARSSGSQPS